MVAVLLICGVGQHLYVYADQRRGLMERLFPVRWELILLGCVCEVSKCLFHIWSKGSASSIALMKVSMNESCVSSRLSITPPGTGSETVFYVRARDRAQVLSLGCYYVLKRGILS